MLMSAPISAPIPRGGAYVDPGNGVQQLNLTAERGDHRLDLGRQAADELVEEVQRGQDGGHDQRVVTAKPGRQCLAQRGQLGR
jgi:hypothetical protein